MASDQSRAAGIGENTARRGVFLKTLMDSAGEGVGKRSGILEQVLRWGDSSSPENLNNLFQPTNKYKQTNTDEELETLRKAVEETDEATRFGVGGLRSSPLRDAVLLQQIAGAFGKRAIGFYSESKVLIGLFQPTNKYKQTNTDEEIRTLRRAIERADKKLGGDTGKNAATGRGAIAQSTLYDARNLASTGASEYKQGILDFERGEPDQSQAGEAGNRARRETVTAWNDLRSTGSLLAQTLSNNLAER